GPRVGGHPLPVRDRAREGIRGLALHRHPGEPLHRRVLHPTRLRPDLHGPAAPADAQHLGPWPILVASRRPRSSASLNVQEYASARGLLSRPWAARVSATARGLRDETWLVQLLWCRGRSPSPGARPQLVGALPTGAIRGEDAEGGLAPSDGDVMLQIFVNPSYDFIGKRRWAYMLSLAVTLVGLLHIAYKGG